jgi:drug/metabolite transporter (DMT)-like permease
VAAFVTVFAVISIGEPIVRGLRPSWQEWMILENLGNVMLAGAENIMERSTLGSFATLTLYLAAVVAVAVVSTTRRDIV